MFTPLRPPVLCSRSQTLVVKGIYSSVLVTITLGTCRQTESGCGEVVMTTSISDTKSLKNSWTLGGKVDEVILQRKYNSIIMRPVDWYV